MLRLLCRGHDGTDAMFRARGAIARLPCGPLLLPSVLSLCFIRQLGCTPIKPPCPADKAADKAACERPVPLSWFRPSLEARRRSHLQHTSRCSDFNGRNLALCSRADLVVLAMSDLQKRGSMLQRRKSEGNEATGKKGIMASCAISVEGKEQLKRGRPSTWRRRRRR